MGSPHTPLHWGKIYGVENYYKCQNHQIHQCRQPNPIIIKSMYNDLSSGSTLTARLKNGTQFSATMPFVRSCRHKRHHPQSQPRNQTIQDANYQVPAEMVANPSCASQQGCQHAPSTENEPNASQDGCRRRLSHPVGVPADGSN